MDGHKKDKRRLVIDRGLQRCYSKQKYSTAFGNFLEA